MPIRQRTWPYPTNIRDIDGINSYLKKMYNALSQESSERLRDFEDMNINSITSTVVEIEPNSQGVGELRLSELAANGINYVGFKPPNSIAANVVWTLPIEDGTAGYGLVTDGSGVLSWDSFAGGAHVMTDHTDDDTYNINTSGTATVDEVRLNPKVSSSGPEGTIYYESTDDHIYVGTE